jgi:UDP-N-acetyl-D-galactosamine dehydrogenase
LPLALEFAHKYYTIGFDIKEDRIKKLRDVYFDETQEVENEILKKVVRNQVTISEDHNYGLFLSSYAMAGNILMSFQT